MNEELTGPVAPVTRTAPAGDGRIAPVIERVNGTPEQAAALIAQLIEEYLDWAGEEQVVRGRIAPDTLPAVKDHVRSNVQADLPLMLGPRGVLLIARQDDKVAGMVGLKPVDAETGEVKRMLVTSQHRGRGAGRDLMDRLIAEARREGYRGLRLETTDFMTVAHGIYRAAGFREVDSFSGNESSAIGLPAEGMHYFKLAL